MLIYRPDNFIIEFSLPVITVKSVNFILSLYKNIEPIFITGCVAVGHECRNWLFSCVAVGKC